MEIIFHLVRAAVFLVSGVVVGWVVALVLFLLDMANRRRAVRQIRQCRRQNSEGM